jgi:hypothetical protein
MRSKCSRQSCLESAGQTSSSTRMLLGVECISLCVLIVLIVLFLPVRCIFLDLQVLKIREFGSMARSEQAK